MITLRGFCCEAKFMNVGKSEIMNCFVNGEIVTMIDLADLNFCERFVPRGARRGTWTFVHVSLE